MKNLKPNILILILVIFLSMFNTITAQVENEFVPLFNGKNLDGWFNVNCAPETWTVRDGKIICSEKPKGVLRTEKQFENYILEMEWRHMTEKGNAGLFIHSEPLPVTGKPFTRSHEIQILDGRNTENYTSHGDIFSIQGATMTPSPLHPNKWMRSLPQERRCNPTGEWNKYRVKSQDGTVELAVNGKVVTKAYHLNPRKGYICLESEGGEIHFRNIRIREQPGSNPPEDVVAKKALGFRPLYNGVDLRGWKQEKGNEGHWKANDYVIEYDGNSEAKDEDRHLWTEEEFSNFTLIVDWRLPRKPVAEAAPIILPDGSQAKDANGKNLTVPILDAGDSGIYLRGTSKCQLNIWNWPVGSGEIWGYRTDTSMPPEVRRAATPILNADNPVGEWNRFEITIIANKVTVVLNGKTVIDEAELPGVPKKGSIALQHHGDPIEFANIYIKELD
jgi:hypothetical protein